VPATTTLVYYFRAKRYIGKVSGILLAKSAVALVVLTLSPWTARQGIGLIQFDLALPKEPRQEQWL
jgi:hypothetical protein